MSSTRDLRRAAYPPTYADGGGSTLYVSDADYRVFATLDFNSGSAAWVFDTPGTFRYCVGCWDPTDSGVIHVK